MNDKSVFKTHSLLKSQIQRPKDRDPNYRIKGGVRCKGSYEEGFIPCTENRMVTICAVQRAINVFLSFSSLNSSDKGLSHVVKGVTCATCLTRSLLLPLTAHVVILASCRSCPCTVYLYTKTTFWFTTSWVSFLD